MLSGFMSLDTVGSHQCASRGSDRWKGRGERVGIGRRDLPVDDAVSVKINQGGREFCCVEADCFLAESVVS